MPNFDLERKHRQKTTQKTNQLKANHNLIILNIET